jgi:hypothetical protein
MPLRLDKDLESSEVIINERHARLVSETTGPSSFSVGEVSDDRAEAMLDSMHRPGHAENLCQERDLNGVAPTPEWLHEIVGRRIGPRSARFCQQLGCAYHGQSL